MALLGPGALAVLRAHAGPGAALIGADGRLRPARALADRFGRDPEAAWRRAARRRTPLLLLGVWPGDIEALRRAVHATGAAALIVAPDLAAAATADLIAACDATGIAQTGDLASLRAAPRSRAVAELFGPVNVLSGTVREIHPGGVVCAVGGARVLHATSDRARPRLGEPVALCLRPDRVALAHANDTGNVLDGIATGDGLIHTAAGPLLGPALPEGAVRIGWAADATVLLAA